MGCVRLRQGQYTFDASAGTVTLLNMHIEPQQLTAIYRIINNGGATAKIALYQGLDPKGGDVTIVGDDTLVTLDFDTTTFDDGDTLRIDLAFNDTFISEVNSTNGLLGAGATFTGAYEYAEPYNTIRVGIKGDIPTDGTLFFDISEDGINTLRSVPRSVSNANFTLPRILSFNDAYIRIRYVNGTTPQTGGFSIVTKYSTDGNLGLNNVMGDIITSETEGQIVKAVITGDVNDANLVPTGIYENVELMPNKGIKAALPNTIVVDYTIPPAGSIPSGTIPAIHPVLNTEPNVYDTGWYPVLGYPSGQLLNFLANQDALIYLLNASDELGANIVGDTQPFLTPIANTGTPFAAPYFDAYSRIVVVNNSGSDITALRLLAKGRQVETPAIYTQLSQPIFDLFPAPITQAVIKGKDDVTGIYNPPNTHNDSKGTSLVVAQGHRLEQVFSRTPFQKSTIITGLVTPISGVVHTVTVGKTLYVTNLQILVVNVLNGVGGNLTIEDGATTIWNYPITPATNQSKTGIDVVIPMESSPLKITDTLQFTLPAGLVGSTGIVNIKAYEEDN